LFRKVKTKEEEPGGKLKTKRRRSRGWIEKERGGGKGRKMEGEKFLFRLELGRFLGWVFQKGGSSLLSSQNV
jgi:hypothetical protein